MIHTFDLKNNLGRVYSNNIIKPNKWLKPFASLTGTG
ncbi:hypothetical protein SAMN05216603_1035 [Pseudomonas benzenivorans]|nr:hypothetical protein SAMN05216603_1035 [Pseudomonas benzenivorans]